MKLSQTDINSLGSLTTAQKTEIVYGGFTDDGQKGEVALLLGGNPDVCRDRAEAAAKLFKAGRVSYIIPSGAPEYEIDGESVSEASLLSRYLIASGVPSGAIIIENEARTTQENMIYGVLQMQRVINIRNVSRVFVVTSAFHLRRSIGLAEQYLPRKIAVSGFAGDIVEGNKQHWMYDAKYTERVENEIRLMKELIDDNQMTDIEY